MKKPVTAENASALIDERIEELADWRGKTLARVRKLIHDADPAVVEEWKWMGTRVEGAGPRRRDAQPGGQEQGEAEGKGEAETSDQQAGVGQQGGHPWRPGPA